MGLGRGLEAGLDDSARELEQLSLEPVRIRCLEHRARGLVGALEEAVRDLDALGAPAQRGQRIDQPLGRVGLRADLLRVTAVQRVALPVDDEHALFLARVDVHDPVHEQAAPSCAGRGERERERQLGADAVGAGDPLAQARGEHPLEHAAKVGHVLLARRYAVALDRGLELGVGGHRGAAEVDPLEQRVDDRAPQQRGQVLHSRIRRLHRGGARMQDLTPVGRRLHRRQSQRPLEVEAVAAAPVGLEARVAQAADRQRARRRRRAELEHRLLERRPLVDRRRCRRPVGRRQHGVHGGGG